MESIGGSLLRRANILAAEAWALLASGANKLALPSDRAVKTTAANVLREKREKEKREREVELVEWALPKNSTLCRESYIGTKSIFIATESYGSPEDLIIAVATLHHEVSSKDVASGVEEEDYGLGHSKHRGCQEHTASVGPEQQTDRNRIKS